MTFSDHQKENYQKLMQKNQEMRNKRMQEEWDRENNVPFKLKEFQDVPSRYAEAV